MTQKVLTIGSGGLVTEVTDAYQGTVTSVSALTLGTTGTDLTSTVAGGTGAAVITLQVPTASAVNRGALSSTDWSTFNGKQAALGYTAANDSSVVHLAGTETISGAKTFSTMKLTDVMQVTGSASPTYPANGAGCEVLFITTGKIGSATGGSGVGMVQSYDRGAGAWRDIWVTCNAFEIDTAGTPRLTISSAGAITFFGTTGFNGTTAIAKPTITGSRVANPALASLLTALASYGLVTDSSTI